VIVRVISWIVLFGREGYDPRNHTKCLDKEALQTHSANMIAALDYTTRSQVEGLGIVKYFLSVTPQSPSIPLAWVRIVS
jgi:hypothetical protein